MTVKRTDRIDGAVARLRFKKRTDVEVVMRFQLNLRTFSVRLWTEKHAGSAPCAMAFSVSDFSKDGGERTVCLQESATNITRETDLAGNDLVERSVHWIRCVHSIRRGFLGYGYETETCL